MKYHETTSEDPLLPAVDATGVTAAGKYWRFKGRYGQSVDYHGVDQEAASLLDVLINGAACPGQF